MLQRANGIKSAAHRPVRRREVRPQLHPPPVAMALKKLQLSAATLNCVRFQDLIKSVATAALLGALAGSRLHEDLKIQTFMFFERARNSHEPVGVLGARFWNTGPTRSNDKV